MVLKSCDLVFDFVLDSVEGSSDTCGGGDACGGGTIGIR